MRREEQRHNVDLPDEASPGHGKFGSALRWFLVGAATASASLLLWTHRWQRRHGAAPSGTPYGEPDLSLEQQSKSRPIERVIYLEPEQVRYPDGRIEHPAIRRELRDVWLGMILAVLVVSALIGGAAAFGIWEFLRIAGRPTVGEPSPYAPPPLVSELPPAPRLDPLITEKPELIEPIPYGLGAVRQLHSYGPTEEAGFVHIPIEKAIQLTAGTLPVRDTPSAGAAKNFGLVGGGEPNSGRLFRSPPYWLRK